VSSAARVPLRVRAPAKINLTLHVTGRRDDGYHLLDSLVIFADLGDRLILDPGPLALAVTGPEARGVPTGPENLVLRAAALAGVTRGRLRLHKILPAQAGIGGGSSDAAATLCLLADPLPPPEALLALGADVPVCLAPGPTRMRDVGADLTPAPPLPECALVLVNPRRSVPTGAVFSALDGRANSPLPDLPDSWLSLDHLIAWLSRTRNDLEPAALGLAPEIATALAALGAQDTCLFARMSGSGATCFGVFPDQTAARAAAAAITRSHADWWCHATRPGPGARQL